MKRFLLESPMKFIELFAHSVVIIISRDKVRLVESTEDKLPCNLKWNLIMNNLTSGLVEEKYDFRIAAVQIFNRVVDQL